MQQLGIEQRMTNIVVGLVKDMQFSDNSIFTNRDFTNFSLSCQCHSSQRVQLVNACESIVTAR